MGPWGSSSATLCPTARRRWPRCGARTNNFRPPRFSDRMACFPVRHSSTQERQWPRNARFAARGRATATSSATRTTCGGAAGTRTSAASGRSLRACASTCACAPPACDPAELKKPPEAAFPASESRRSPRVEAYHRNPGDPGGAGVCGRGQAAGAPGARRVGHSQRQGDEARRGRETLPQPRQPRGPGALAGSGALVQDVQLERERLFLRGLLALGVDAAAVVFLYLIALDLLAVDCGPHVGRRGRLLLAPDRTHQPRQDPQDCDGTLRHAGSFSIPMRGTQLQAAFLTRPDRRQAVHTRTCLRTPSMSARTRRRFGFQRRRRTLFAWLMMLP